MRRCILVGDRLDGWSAFGGLAAQLRFLCIAIHIATAENGAFSIMYDPDARTPIRRIDRLRGGEAWGRAEIKQRLNSGWAKGESKNAPDKDTKSDRSGMEGTRGGSRGAHKGSQKGEKGGQ